MFSVVFLFGTNLESGFMPLLQRSDLTIHRDDRVFVIRIRRGLIVRPEKTLDRVLKRRVFGPLNGVGNEAFEILGACKPTGLTSAGNLKRKSPQAVTAI